MANFKIEKIRKGYLGAEESFLAITEIIFDEKDKIITLPAFFNGKPVTHLGYKEIFVPGHEVWADWHHPAKGSDFEPDKYELDSLSYLFPPFVEKVVIPKTITNISYYAFYKSHFFKLEIEKDNPHFLVKDDKLFYKNGILFCDYDFKKTFL